MKPVPAAVSIAATAGAATPRRAAKGGIVAGLLGAVCCMIGAVAVGAGLAGASFATTLMDRYQTYAIVASVLFLAGWLIRLVRTSGLHRPQLRRYARQLARHAVVMAGAYGLTLGAALGVSTLIRSIG